VSYASDNLSHQHFGLVVVSCERADLRPLPNGVMIYADSEAKLDPLPPPRIPRVEVIDELCAAVIGRQAAAARWALGMATLEVCLAMLESARENRDIALHRQVARPPSRHPEAMQKPIDLRRERLAHIVKVTMRAFHRALQMRLARARRVDRTLDVSARAVADGRPHAARAERGGRARRADDVHGAEGDGTPRAMSCAARPRAIAQAASLSDARGRALEAKLVPLAEDVNAVAVRGLSAADVAKDEAHAARAARQPERRRSAAGQRYTARALDARARPLVERAHGD
jgi:hypothetical protein